MQKEPLYSVDYQNNYYQQPMQPEIPVTIAPNPPIYTNPPIPTNYAYDAPVAIPVAPQDQPIPVAVPIPAQGTAQAIRENSAVLRVKYRLFETMTNSPTFVTCPNCHSQVKTVVPAPKWVIMYAWMLLLICSFPILFFAFFGLVVFIGLSNNPGYIAVVFPVTFVALTFILFCMMSKQKKV